MSSKLEEKVFDVNRAELDIHIDLWKETQRIAMHFNELLLNYRLKSIAGITLAAGAAMTLLRNAKGAPDFRALAAVSVLLMIIWVGIWLLDFKYYQRLLGGAVQEAMKIEAKTKGVIKLSTTIEMRFQGERVRWGRWAFYGCPTLVLAAVPCCYCLL